MAIKIFVLGNPGGGKSTLVKSIQTEAESFGSRIKHRLTKVKGVDEKTAGIIPYDICSKTLGHITMFDFAGHREYYAGHDALLRNSMTDSPSIIILVVDMKDEEGKIRETVEYWLEFLAQQYNEGGPKPHLLVIGSHADEIPSSEVRSRSKLFQSLLNDYNLENFVHIDKLVLDCRYAESSSMSNLRQKLLRSCQQLRAPEKLKFPNHCFLVFLLNKFIDHPAIKLTTAVHALKEEVKHKALWEIIKSLDVHSTCEELNKQGSILFMKNHKCLENSWIVLDKTVLLSQVNGKIFAPDGFNEYQKVATSTGVVPLSKLTTLFPNLNPNMISQFLCHLEFCQEITDVNVLALLQSEVVSSTKERFFFFPALVPVSYTHLTLPTIYSV